MEPLLHPTTNKAQTVPLVGQLDPNKSAFAYYSEAAALEDDERAIEWEKAMDAVLVFAGLFATFLSGFILKTMENLEEDTADINMRTLIHLSSQQGNSSISPFTPEPFTPDTVYLVINGLFYASLGIILVSAMMSMIVKQWIREFERGLKSILNAEERALQRKARWNALQESQLGNIVAGLPLALIFSLALFLVGLILYIWQIKPIIAIIFLAFTAPGFILFFWTTSNAAIHQYSPYSSPISRALGYLINTISILFRSKDKPLLPFHNLIPGKPLEMPSQVHATLVFEIIEELLSKTATTTFNVPIFKSTMNAISEVASKKDSHWIHVEKAKEFLNKPENVERVKDFISLLTSDGWIVQHVGKYQDVCRPLQEWISQHAVKHGWLEETKELVKMVDINKPDEDNRTLLYYAAFRSHRPIVELLIQHEADPEVPKVSIFNIK